MSSVSELNENAFSSRSTLRCNYMRVYSLIHERACSTDLLHVGMLPGQLQSGMRDYSTSRVDELTVYIPSASSPLLSTSSMQSLRIFGTLF